MYLLALHVPIFKDNSLIYVTTEWKRSLELLRDSFDGYFNEFCVIAPYCEIANSQIEQNFELANDIVNVTFIPSIPHTIRARQYWSKYRKIWLSDVNIALKKSQIFHGGFADIYKPLNFDALNLAHSLNVPTVFARDTDELLKHKQMVKLGYERSGIKSIIKYFFYKKLLQHCVSKSSLSLLKGRSLYNKYSSFSANCKIFHDTSHLSSEIVPHDIVTKRLATLSQDRPLKFIYCGRFEKRKGLSHSIEILYKMKLFGYNIQFDLIGDGEQRLELESLVNKYKLEDNIRFLGRVNYNSKIFFKLAEYDALFFTPLAEDTPRMIFDAYASGLPIIGYDIEYLIERSEEDHTVLLCSLGDIESSAKKLMYLYNDRSWLVYASNKALLAAHKHAADVWYKRRAQWTIEMYEKHNQKSITK